MKYEKWSFGYWLLKQYVIFADWLIHKNIIVTGKEKIPKNKPLIFAPNHQNALSDPLAVLLHTRVQPVWLARADIFKSNIVNTILRFMKIMPVYRLRDGKENLAKNEQTFSASTKVLKNNSALALFPEAAHSGKRQMLAHKKAVPRIVFMAEEKSDFNLDIQIIPTGIYYSHYWKFNRTVIINFGNPIPVKDYTYEYQESPNSATGLLKSKIHDSILPLVIDFRTKKYYKDFERIREIYGRHFLIKLGKRNTTLNLFYSDQKLANRLDKLEKQMPEETEKLVSAVRGYIKVLKQTNLRNWLVEQPQNNLIKLFLNTLLLLTSLPVFVYGFLLNAIPFFTTDRLIRKKVKDHTFWSTFFLVAGIILFPLVYLVEFLALSWIFPGIWLKILFLLSMPFAGKLAFKWYILLRKTIGRYRLLSLKFFQKEQYKNLQQEKRKLFDLLDNMILD